MTCTVTFSACSSQRDCFSLYRLLFPLSVSYSYSTDGKEYHLWKTIDMPEERSGMVLFRGVKADSEVPLQARYLKVEVTGTKVCPHWHYGVGHPSWFFIDEITVQ